MKIKVMLSESARSRARPLDDVKTQTRVKTQAKEKRDPEDNAKERLMKAKNMLAQKRYNVSRNKRYVRKSPTASNKKALENAEKALDKQKDRVKELAQKLAVVKKVKKLKAAHGRVNNAVLTAKEKVKAARDKKRQVRSPARKKAIQLKIERLQSRVDTLTKKKREAAQAVKDARK